MWFIRIGGPSSPPFCEKTEACQVKRKKWIVDRHGEQPKEKKRK
jgi:hypothetical protein